MRDNREIGIPVYIKKGEDMEKLPKRDKTQVIRWGNDSFDPQKAPREKIDEIIDWINEKEAEGNA